MNMLDNDDFQRSEKINFQNKHQILFDANEQTKRDENRERANSNLLMFYKKRFLTTEEVLSTLRNAPKVVLPSIPPDLKESTMFIIDNNTNAKRKSEGKKSDMNLKSVKFVKGKYVRDNQVGKQRFLEELSPQPTNVVTLCRYYTELKRDSEYKRRVSWI